MEQLDLKVDQDNLLQVLADYFIYPTNPADKIDTLVFQHIGDNLAGCSLDFYLCPDDQLPTTTTTSSSSTSTSIN